MPGWTEPSLTGQQQRRIHAQLTGLGVKARGDRLTILSAITERPVLSTTTLTMVEADRVTERLQQYVTHEALAQDYLGRGAA